MNKLSGRSASRLTGVHPILVACVVLAMKRLSGQLDFSVVEGPRSIDQQAKYFRNGLSKTLNSKHLFQNDGFGHAVDLCPVGFKTMDDVTDEAWCMLAEAMFNAAYDLGLVIKWGRNWETKYSCDRASFCDQPHFEIVRRL